MRPFYPHFVRSRVPFYVAGILGAAVGLTAAYLFSKPGLRKELKRADSARNAVEIFGKHVREDSHEFSKDMRDFLHHPRFQARWNRFWHGIDDRKEAMGSDAKETARRAEAAKDRALTKAKELVKNTSA